MDILWLVCGILSLAIGVTSFFTDWWVALLSLFLGLLSLLFSLHHRRVKKSRKMVTFFGSVSGSLALLLSIVALIVYLVLYTMLIALS